MVKIENLMVGCIVQDKHGIEYRIKPEHFSEVEKDHIPFILPVRDSNAQDFYAFLANKLEFNFLNQYEFSEDYKDGSYYSYDTKDRSLYIVSNKHVENIIFYNIEHLHDLQIKVFSILGVMPMFESIREKNGSKNY